LINQGDFESRHFRIGKSLNPDLPNFYKGNDWVFGRFSEKLSGYGGRDFARSVWEGWQEGRNLLFHYYPNHQNFITLKQARIRVLNLIGLMEKLVGWMNKENGL
jgi:hypothetical protein